MLRSPARESMPATPPARAVRKSDGFRARWAQRVERALVWNNIYRATSYLRSALWTIPFLSILVVLVIAPVLPVVDRWLKWRLTGLSVAGAQALYQTVITMTLSFLVFTFGSLLVAIQVAGGQLTPRIIATTLLRNNVVRYSVGLFVFTLVFAVGALNRQEESVSELVSLVTGDSRGRLHRRLPVPDRLRGASAATGQRCRPHRRRGRRDDQGRVSRSGQPRCRRSAVVLPNRRRRRVVTCTAARRKSCSPSISRRWWHWRSATTA